MEVKPGYKQTEAGVIPEDWEVKQLGDLADIRSGGTPNTGDPIAWDGPIPWCTPTDITALEGRKYLKETERTITEYGLRNSAAELLPARSIVMTSRATIGECAINTVPMTSNQGFKNLVPLDSVDVEFLYYLLCTQKQGLIELSAGSTFLEIGKTQVKRYEVKLPSTKTEQTAIATTLGDMDALLDGLDRLIAKKRAIKQATMQKLLTGQTRLPGFSGEWEVKRLGDLVQIRKGKTITAKMLIPGEIPVMAGGREPAYFHASANRYGKTITVSASGASAGYVAFHSFPIFASDCSTIGESESYCIEFLYYCLIFRQDVIYAAQTGGAQPHVHLKNLIPLSISIPDDITEQTAIAEVLSDMDAEITALETRRSKTRALKQAMMQELLTGRTRLITPDAHTADKAGLQTAGRKANIHFLRSVLAAEIIDQLHDQPTFGHVKFEKMMFLTELLCRVDTGSTYHRKAAGPYDNRALRSIDSQLRKQQWFEARKQDGRYQYVPLAKRGGHQPYFERHFSAIAGQLQKILGAFKTAKTEQCEIVATLLAAWSDLLREQGAASDEMIVHEVLHNWHEAKRRIPKERWLTALGWMRGKGFVPPGASSP